MHIQIFQKSEINKNNKNLMFLYSCIQTTRYVCLIPSSLYNIKSIDS